MTRRVFVLVPVALLCALSVSCSAFAVAAATVNGQKITESEVESELDRVRSDPSFQEVLRRQADEVRGLARRNILTGLIRQAVLSQEASLMNIHVTRAQIDRLIREEAKRQGVSVEDFRRAQKLSVEDARTIARRIVQLFELRRAVIKDVDVDDERVREAYEAQKEAFSEAHLFRITVRTAEEARRVLEDIEQGASFSVIARRRSIDERAEDGGDLGYVRVGTLGSSVQAGLAQAKIGGVTDPIATASGFEIYRLTDRRTPPLGDVADQIRSQLSDQTLEARFEAWLGERIRGAKVVVNPKYGRFDRQQLQVVPGSRELPE